MMKQLVAFLVLGFARLLTGLRVRWQAGKPNGEQCIFVANHSSHGDFVLVWAALPPGVRVRTRPVAAADYWAGSGVRGFIAGKVFRAVLIDRLKVADGPKSVDVMNVALSNGDSLILFPEGTRNTSDETLLPLKRGVYELAKSHAQAVVIPAWIENLRRVLPKGSVIPVPLACTVSFGAPMTLQSAETAEHFLDRLRAAILACRPSSAQEE